MIGRRVSVGEVLTAHYHKKAMYTVVGNRRRTCLNSYITIVFK